MGRTLGPGRPGLGAVVVLVVVDVVQVHLKITATFKLFFAYFEIPNKVNVRS